MRSIIFRDLESTPGQLYWLRPDPAMISTRNGRSDVGSLPFSSFGFTTMKFAPASEMDSFLTRQVFPRVEVCVQGARHLAKTSSCAVAETGAATSGRRSAHFLHDTPEPRS